MSKVRVVVTYSKGAGSDGSGNKGWRTTWAVGGRQEEMFCNI